MKTSAKPLRKACLILIGTIATLAVTACHSNVRPLQPVQLADDYCKHGVPKRSSVLAVLTTIDDTPSTAPQRKPAEILAHLQRSGGTVAHWTDLNLLKPNIAKLYGDSEGYIHVLAAAVDNPPADAQSRTIELLIHTPKSGNTWHEFHALDLQNICVEGTPQS